jgi:hypothetical protein
MSLPTLLLAVVSTAFAAPTSNEVWQPQVGTPYQMILTDVVDPTVETVQPAIAPIYDIDLFYHPKSTFNFLHFQGKKVICYFSAGSSEDWRPDYKDFPEEDKGPCYDGWAGERWLNIKSDGVFDVMKKRIDLAAEKGCDGIDPDNVDGWENEDIHFNLTKKDSVDYFKRMADYAHGLRLAVGLKNAQDMLDDVLGDAEFAVNESCSQFGDDCQPYTKFFAQGKPVFHVEYISSYTIKNGKPVIASSNLRDSGETSDQLKAQFCLKTQKGNLVKYMSTTIKFLNLDGWVLYCDDTFTNTTTTWDGVKKGQIECPNGN